MISILALFKKVRAPSVLLFMPLAFKKAENNSISYSIITKVLAEKQFCHTFHRTIKKKNFIASVKLTEFKFLFCGDIHMGIHPIDRPAAISICCICKGDKTDRGRIVFTTTPIENKFPAG